MKFFLGMSLSLICSGSAFASGYGMAGCGLGSVLLGSSGGQISAATTNDSTYTQPFGISSGTSNCVPDKAISAEETNFIINNFASFEKDVARGEGITIVALGELLDCQVAVIPDMSRKLQGSYDDIFDSPGAINALVSAKAQLKDVPSIRAACSKLI